MIFTNWYVKNIWISCKGQGKITPLPNALIYLIKDLSYWPGPLTDKTQYISFSPGISVLY